MSKVWNSEHLWEERREVNKLTKIPHHVEQVLPDCIDRDAGEKALREGGGYCPYCGSNDLIFNDIERHDQNLVVEYFTCGLCEADFLMVYKTIEIRVLERGNTVWEAE